MFKISDEIVPMPPQRSYRETIYPFADMAVGQHFDAPRDMGKAKGVSDKRQKAINSSASGWAKRHNPTAKFTTRLWDENTVRCWRIA